MSAEEWWRQFKADVRECSELELSSYCYDDPSTQRVLEQRLRSKTMALNVYLDHDMFYSGRKYMKSRIAYLYKLGASVYICAGSGPKGSYHCKAAVVNKRVVYAGSANFTFTSHLNEEFLFRMKGPHVGKLLERLAAHRSQGQLYDVK